MSSGHQQCKCAYLNQFEEAYATTSVASLIIDPHQRAVFANDAARHLLRLEEEGQLESLHRPLEASEEEKALETLGSLIEDLFEEKIPAQGWKGRLAHCPDQPVEARFVELPTPPGFVLCQLLPHHQLEREKRVRLISDLAEVHYRSKDLEEAGRLVVEAIHHHLDRPVFARCRRANDEQSRWQAGDEPGCRRLADLRGPSLTPSSEIAAFYDDGKQGAIHFQLHPGEELSAELLISIDAPEQRLRESQPFWNCLATTAENSLRTARLHQLDRRRRRRLRAVMEHMPMAVMLFDTEGHILDLNLRARAMSGRHQWTRVGVDDHPFEVCDIDGNALPKEKWPLLGAVLTGEGYEEEEYVLDFGNTQRTLSISVIPITDEDDRVTSFLATARDVTQRSKKERRKDEFLSVASHELRSPLTPLSGFLHMARNQVEQGEPVDPELLRRADAQVERLQRLIDSLLDMTRLETGKLPLRRSEVEMVPLLRRIVAPWKEGPNGHRLHLNTPDSRVSAKVDPDRIDQVLTNVIDNAFKHGRDDGQVRVELEEAKDQILLTVRDDGDGMPQSIIDRVFERYFFDETIESAGTGIGLYISRQIVEDHGGTISIASGRGEPTTVTICLPLTAP